MVTTIVNTIEIIIIALWLKIPEKTSNDQPPKYAPATPMVSFPKKYAVKNFVGLYFINPRGITIGSSGIGEAAATKRSGNAHFRIFITSASSRLRLSSLRRLLT